jgi:VanZ family protein
MSYLQPTTAESPQLTLPMAWLPASLGLLVICAESTPVMAGGNTSRWLLELCHALWGQTDGATFETTHLLLRKIGHFCGYGTLGLLFFRGWHSSLRRLWQGLPSSLRFAAASMAVLSTFIVACLDEWHQSFLPGRVSSPHDVAIDTAGAIAFLQVMMFVTARGSV